MKPSLNDKYQATLTHLYRQLPMFQRVGAMAFKKDLGNIQALCDALAQPQNQYPSIHIAGTNGKGSTAHILSAVLQAAGYKVGLYTSPHYRDFRERIKINGKLMKKTFVLDFVEQQKTLFETLKPSFFEITVAMAFAYFAEQKVDVAIIETGLGGRLDSTNIIKPILSIITNISFDHQQMLGDTLPQIAAEKAGIIKKRIPVVIGEEQEAVKAVFEKVAAEQEAGLHYASRRFSLSLKEEDLSHSYYEVREAAKLRYARLAVNLHGAYQTKNLATVFQALALLPDFDISEAAIKKGLFELKTLTRFLGRWQSIGTAPQILCDSAHNEAGLSAAMQQLKALQAPQLHIVLGVVNDKDLSTIFPFFPKAARYYFAKANIPRGLAAQSLREQAAAAGLEGRAYTSVKNALRAARRRAKPDEVIYVGGSIFTVAEVV